MLLRPLRRDELSQGGRVERMRLPAWLVASVASLLGCSSSPPTGAPVTASETSTATRPPEAAPSSPGSPPATPSGNRTLVGLWASPRCGDRGYERTLELQEGGHFVAHDRVSPCPPGAQCVWSGIVTRGGTWSVVGPSLLLTVEKDGKGPKTSALPAKLDVAGEAPSEGPGDGCSYTRR